MTQIEFGITDRTRTRVRDEVSISINNMDKQHPIFEPTGRNHFTFFKANTCQILNGYLLNFRALGCLDYLAHRATYEAGLLNQP